jgi:hypothetical protein
MNYIYYFLLKKYFEMIDLEFIIYGDDKLGNKGFKSRKIN